MSGSDLTITILDQSRYKDWNDFVDQSPQGDVFCYSWWLNAITKSHFEIYAILQNDQIVAGMPLAYDKYNRINEPPLTRTLGVLYKLQSGSVNRQRSIERGWLTKLVECIQADDFVQVCMHHNFKDWLPFRWKGFRQTTRYTYLLSYKDKTIDDLKKNLNKGRKYSIGKALKNQIRIEETDDFKLLYDFTQLSYERQGRRLNVPFSDLSILDETIKQNGKRKIFKAIDPEKKIHAVMYISFNKKSAYYLLSGSDPRYRGLGGHTLIVWEAIKFFSGKVEYFNFGGSDIKCIEEHVNGFGGEITPYYHIYNERNLHINDVRYHLKEISLHMHDLTRAIRNKFFQN